MGTVVQALAAFRSYVMGSNQKSPQVVIKTPAATGAEAGRVNRSLNVYEALAQVFFEAHRQSVAPSASGER